RDSGFFEDVNKETEFIFVSLENILKPILHENRKLPSYHIRENFYSIKKNSCSFEITSNIQEFFEFNNKFEQTRSDDDEDTSDDSKLPLEYYLKPIPIEQKIVPYYGKKTTFITINKQNSCSFFVDL
ncbi:25911_t:CDS:1, partial [Dentiscutata erythropus]